MELMKKIECYEGLEIKLKTNREMGIKDDPAEKKLREKAFGNNHPIVKEPTTICELICG